MSTAHKHSKRSYAYESLELYKNAHKRMVRRAITISRYLAPWCIDTRYLAPRCTDTQYEFGNKESSCMPRGDLFCGRDSLRPQTGQKISRQFLSFYQIQMMQNTSFKFRFYYTSDGIWSNSKLILKLILPVPT
jgi:hypothetical protein